MERGEGRKGEEETRRREGSERGTGGKGRRRDGGRGRGGGCLERS